MSAMKLTLFLIGSAVALSGQQHPIDKEKSAMTIHVGRAGLLAAFGHDHEIAAPVAGGTVDTAAHRVELRVEAGALKVLDPKASEKDRAEVQATMLGPEVLDVTRHPEIAFRSTTASPSGAGAWNVQGSLTLHGQTKPI